MSPEQLDGTGRTARLAERTQHQIVLFSSVLFAGALVVSILLGAAADEGVRLGAGVTAFLVFTSAGAAGVFLGFVFGMPRSRLADAAALRRGTPKSGEGTSAGARYAANTNLTRISDWLTTIVVGLTLVNIDQVVTGAQHLADDLRAPLGGGDYGGAAGLAMTVVGFVAGFALMYFWTTVRGRQLLEDADQADRDDADRDDADRDDADRRDETATPAGQLDR